MPIRTASLNPQLKKNGVRLHLATLSRVHSSGADQPTSSDEQALLAERAALKQARTERHAQAKLPKVKAVPVAKETKVAKVKAPKAPKAPKEPKAASAGKGAKPSRAEKMDKKAANVEAAKKAEKKSAKT